MDAFISPVFSVQQAAQLPNLTNFGGESTSPAASQARPTGSTDPRPSPGASAMESRPRSSCDDLASKQGPPAAPRGFSKPWRFRGKMEVVERCLTLDVFLKFQRVTEHLQLSSKMSCSTASTEFFALQLLQPALSAAQMFAFSCHGSAEIAMGF